MLKILLHLRIKLYLKHLYIKTSKIRKKLPKQSLK